MARRYNRKKQYKLQLKRQGLLKAVINQVEQTVEKVVDKTKEAVHTASQMVTASKTETADLQDKQSIAEKAAQSKADVASSSLADSSEVSSEKETSKASSEVLSRDAFAELAEVSELRADIVAVLFEAGIRSAAAFSQWTEAELLALKGIGPATISKLKENGVSFKK
ncbi:TPA: DNA-binding protein [Streptococcus equi subsp. zooepidemicus]|uniref:DNA-binding protein n=1 Tax=Streptococcus equi TaxID=1336 RepID=UPI000DA31B9C|nr:DNA-binding protein [Streptococcus equi]MCD3391554.1 DNA-binding protein [Streptococcus equi subsp. zooepidemicus]MCD3401423.1 DNA-binding protein [Streptococcus equi subsp. zooepidemicus]MCD3404446.1 DNA-binding protein [Streptococcus equi subsp. zooepidemicus]MCD3461019.1 DNA-binding protein [Streptococcus equi subsp. zooepidemicus]MDI5952810.1 DNA-binding protein [Streptococcus equi subsp. zooepidemicus]